MRRLSYIALLLLTAGTFTACKPLRVTSVAPTDDAATAARRFASVQNILATKCKSCHDYGSLSEAEWMKQGLVIAGDPAGSILFRRLRGSNVAGGEQNMPPTEDLLRSELTAISQWITKLEEPDDDGGTGVGTGTGTGDGTGGGDPMPAAIASLFQARCSATGCHPSFGTTTTNQGWLNSGYIVAGSAMTSTLFKRLVGAGAGGTENMPQGSAPLAAGEITAIRNWIDGLQATGGATGRRQAALAVITGRCGACHGSTNIATSSLYAGATVPAFTLYTTDNDFVNSGLVVVKNKDESWLYQALTDYGSINTMPSGGTLTATEAQALADWIDHIGDP